MHYELGAKLTQNIIKFIALMNGFNKNPLIAVGTTGKMSCEKDISTNY